MPEVIVIGGGIVGLSCAAELAERGMEVLLLEKDDIGFEQSGRSTAAVILPDQGSAPPYRSLAALGAHGWSRFSDRWGCEIELNREGWIHIAQDVRDWSQWESDSLAWSRLSGGVSDGFDLQRADASARFPALTGSFIAANVRSGGHVNPTLVLRGLREGGQRAGVEYRIGTMATGFDVRKGRVHAVCSSDGPIACGDVVIAAGLWTDRLCDLLECRVPVRHVRAPVGVTGPVPNVIPGFLRGGTFGARQNADGTIRISGGWRNPGVIHDVSLTDLAELRTWLPVLRRRRADVALCVDRRTLVRDLRLRYPRGGRREKMLLPTDWEPSPSRRSTARKLQSLISVVPVLKGLRIHQRLAGLVEVTPDMQPVIGRLPAVENTYVLGGFSGHGFILGPAAAQSVADLITGPTSPEYIVDMDQYRPERFMGRRLPVGEVTF